MTAVAGDNASLRVASYNLRYNNPGDNENAWPHRKEAVKALIVFHDFDIFGTQEGLKGQLDAIGQLSQYAYTGAGRDDGKNSGEHSAIFYKKDRFQLLESGNFWLSTTPDVPSMGWDARCCKRICSWGKFQDNPSGRIFYFFNVHFDHEGKTARIESGKLMVQRIKEIAGDTPVICTGDFNSLPETEQIQTMQTILNDSYAISLLPPYGPVGTFNAFNPNAVPRGRIDYIFTDKRMKVLKYGVLTDRYDNKFPSDHFPIVADIQWGD
jgi:endonuclease/exonuclease/phosphatase family metal-dependent hydrolase